MTPRDREALGRIVDHIEKIESYLKQVGSGWPGDDMAVDAIAKRFEVAYGTGIRQRIR